jgi:hypothetical protein
MQARLIRVRLECPNNCAIYGDMRGQDKLDFYLCRQTLEGRNREYTDRLIRALRERKIPVKRSPADPERFIVDRSPLYPSLNELGRAAMEALHMNHLTVELTYQREGKDYLLGSQWRYRFGGNHLGAVWTYYTNRYDTLLLGRLYAVAGVSRVIAEQIENTTYWALTIGVQVATDRVRLEDCLPAIVEALAAS